MEIKRLTPAARRVFRRKIYDHFSHHGRAFSWRKTRDPYHIFVSEVMLQQTQAERVENKFPVFITAFPDIDTLASAPMADVLTVWQGMGYNRRALFLQKAACQIRDEYGGKIPSTVEQLERLSGIGPATARSIAAYAFNCPVPFIETNIRTVFIHCFFPGRTGVSDREIYPLVEQTLDRDNPWKWYNALMDYGVMLKEKHGNPGRHSAHYKKQSSFRNSDRRVRGGIIRFLTEKAALNEGKFIREALFEKDRVVRSLQSLVKDGMIIKIGNKYFLPGNEKKACGKK